MSELGLAARGHGHGPHRRRLIKRCHGCERQEEEEGEEVSEREIGGARSHRERSLRGATSGAASGAKGGPPVGKVARWQNLIPSFPWIAPGWRALGAQSKERKGSNFAA